MADPREGSIPHVMPFHRSLPVTSAYFQNSPWKEWDEGQEGEMVNLSPRIQLFIPSVLVTPTIAVAHSTTDDTWIAHVGRESALAGSVCSSKARAGSHAAVAAANTIEKAKMGASGGEIDLADALGADVDASEESRGSPSSDGASLICWPILPLSSSGSVCS